MKIGNPANYYVRVRARSWDEDPEQAALYAGMYAFDLNQLVRVSFVPVVTAPRPWSLDHLPADITEFTTPQQARVHELLLTDYSVTPDDERAGTAEQFDWPFDWTDPATRPRPTVFYATSDEFDRLSADLEKLSDFAGELHSLVQRSEVLDHEVVRFIERRILDSGLLTPDSANSIGR
ncbi:hypothetical protein MRQ36_21660 [Micromonospora sp. R77]|uniref:hypothetical protein n=1 Tax=Micromonospora sp. R77 TaxID=2925836 RepID=UPI001F61FE11|nr:hypothetical protein [Micromonospora sp. R77]MCI4065026.1 hypothetical protein [Micromonospora sp. R77]